jgi:hypothetical protein
VRISLDEDKKQKVRGTGKLDVLKSNLRITRIRRWRYKAGEREEWCRNVWKYIIGGLDMCYAVHFREVFIETPTNAPLIYYTIISCVCWVECL